MCVYIYINRSIYIIIYNCTNLRPRSNQVLQEYLKRHIVELFYFHLCNKTTHFRLFHYSI